MVNKLKKVRVVAELDDPLVVADLRGRQPRTIKILTLRQFTIDEGNVHWRFEDDRGHATFGGVGTVCTDAEERIQIALAIPVHMHLRRAGLAPEFIVRLPVAWHINSLHFMKKKYPNQRFDPLSDVLL